MQTTVRNVYFIAEAKILYNGHMVSVTFRKGNQHSNQSIAISEI